MSGFNCTTCPVCGSDNIDMHESCFDVDNCQYEEYFWCDHCDSTWVATYPVTTHVEAEEIDITDRCEPPEDDEDD